MRITALIVALLLAASAHAQAASAPATAALGWTVPTTYVDNTTLPASAIAGYAVFYGPQSRFATPTTLRTGCSGPTSQTDTSCYPNTAFSAGPGLSFSVTTTITQSTTIFYAVATKTTSGDLSQYSTEASKAFTVTTSSVKPNPPTLITITITLGACTTNVPGTTCTVTSP